MSRLDSVIRRLQAQRACLEMAAALIEGVEGPVLELGLGNGRTFDHLRQILPGRAIFVYERKVAAHPDCRPDEAHLIEGDIFATLPASRARLPAPAALAHADIGTGETEPNARIAAFLGAALPELMAPAAVILADRDLPLAGWQRLPPPDGIAAERYFLWRRA